MKKRVISIATALMLVISMLFAAMDASASGVTAQEGGPTDIRFSNGYQGYCLDYNDKVAAVNDEFSIAGANEITHNVNGNNVSQNIKAIFALYFEELYEEDGMGGYKLIASDGNDGASIIQSVIWHLTDDRYIYGIQKTIYDGVMAYTGPVIPDEGYEITLSNGDKIVFSFMTLEPVKTGLQVYLAFRFDVIHPGVHTHNYSENWTTGEDKHWKECSCGDKTQEAKHEGEVRNQVEAGEFTNGYTGDTYCKVCDKLLEEGTLVPATHEHDYSDNWKDNKDKHWKECSCGDKKEEADHEGVLKNQVDAKEFEDGYTGDIRCKDCDKLLEEGSVIPATHEHEYKEEWTGGENKHWHECSCGDKKDEASHEGEVRDRVEAGDDTEGYSGDTYCKVCDKLMEKGEIIPANHEHEYSEEWTKDGSKHWHECLCGDKKDEASHEGEVRNQVEAGEFKDGYSGDTYCKVCDKLMEEGKVIPATHEHEYGEEWTGGKDEHWHECSCDDKIDKEAHTGGKATCVDKAVCEKCETEYGTKDKENHVGEVEVRDAVEPTTKAPGYTGDAYCKSCEALLEKGTVIPQLEEPSEEDDVTTEGDDETTTEDKDETTTAEEEETTSTEEEKAPVADKEESGPDTGDKSMVWVYLAVAVISFAGCVIGLVKKKNTNN